MKGAINTIRAWRDYCRDARNCGDCLVIRQTGRCFAAPVMTDAQIRQLVGISERFNNTQERGETHGIENRADTGSGSDSLEL